MKKTTVFKIIFVLFVLISACFFSPSSTAFQPGSRVKEFINKVRTSTTTTTTIIPGVSFPVPLTGNVDGKYGDDLLDCQSGNWKIKLSDNSSSLFQATTGTLQFGIPGEYEIPLRGDFDGDNKVDIALFRHEEQRWDIKLATENGSFGDAYAVTFGNPSIGIEIPLTGDFNGDKRLDLVTFWPEEGQWNILFATTGGAFRSEVKQTKLGSGNKKEVPLIGDFNGDNLDDISYFRPNNGTWYIELANGAEGFYSEVKEIALGSPNQVEIPIVGDFNGDNLDDIATFRKADGVWRIKPATPDGNFSSEIVEVPLGNPNLHEIPLVGDFNADAFSDLAQFRPEENAWRIRLSAGVKGGCLFKDAVEVKLL